MQGVFWVARNDRDRENILRAITERPFPYQVKVAPLHSPKTTRQIRYAHSLCNALATARRAPPEAAKRDAKAAFGVVVVSSSLVTGDRTVRLKSFADYTRDEMEAFCTEMEVYLARENIEFTGSR